MKYIVISMTVPLQSYEIEADRSPTVDSASGRLKFVNERSQTIAEFVNWGNWRVKEGQVGETDTAIRP